MHNPLAWYNCCRLYDVIINISKFLNLIGTQHIPVRQSWPVHPSTHVQVSGAVQF